MKTFEVKIKITVNNTDEAKLIGNFLQTLVDRVPLDTQKKLAEKSRQNPDGIARVLSNPMVKMAL